MKMPFGRYKGEEIEDLPSSYLHWIMQNISDKERENSVLLAVEEEYSFRSQYNTHFDEFEDEY